MTDVVVKAWPTPELRTDRLLIREPRADDRDGLIDMYTSADARRHLGGPVSSERAEEGIVAPYGETPGSFVVRDRTSGAFVGTVEIDRRDSSRPGHVSPSGGELEVSYVLLPDYWGKGYAQEAVRMVLAWAATVLPDAQVIAVTQTANNRSIALLKRLGFSEVERFKEFGEDQSLSVVDLTPFAK
jgi:RimJ/RimL family protein N-acetyltransferase